jgi:hypothetical protein
VTPEDIAEAFRLVRQNSSALVHPLVDSLERMMQHELEARELFTIRLALIEGLVERRTKAIL